MLHEKIEARGRVDGIDVAAVWPVSAQVAPVPIPEVEGPAEAFRPTPAAPDVPAGVGAMIFVSYAMVIVALFFAAAGTAYSVFMITISALFVIMFFAVPRLFLKVEPRDRPRTSFDNFMYRGIQTMTGHSTGSAALIQMMIVPVFLAIGISAMGIAARILM